MKEPSGHAVRESGPGGGKPPDHDDRRRRKFVVWAVTAGVMAVIVVVWAVLLPLQIRQLRENGQDETRARWGVRREASEQSGPAPSFRESLNNIGDTLDRLTSGLDFGGSTETPVTSGLNANVNNEIEAQKLKEALQEASQDIIIKPNETE